MFGIFSRSVGACWYGLKKWPNIPKIITRLTFGESSACPHGRIPTDVSTRSEKAISLRSPPHPFLTKQPSQPACSLPTRPYIPVCGISRVSLIARVRVCPTAPTPATWPSSHLQSWPEATSWASLQAQNPSPAA